MVREGAVLKGRWGLVTGGADGTKRDLGSREETGTR